MPCLPLLTQDGEGEEYHETDDPDLVEFASQLAAKRGVNTVNTKASYATAINPAPETAAAKWMRPTEERRERVPMTGVRTNAKGVAVPLLFTGPDSEWAEQGEQADLVEPPPPGPETPPSVAEEHADEEEAEEEVEDVTGDAAAVPESHDEPLVVMEAPPENAVLADAQEDDVAPPTQGMPVLPKGDMPAAPAASEEPDMEVILPAPPPAVVFPAGSGEDNLWADLDAEVAALSGVGVAPLDAPFATDPADDACDADALNDPELKRLETEAAAAAMAAEQARVAAEQARKAANDAREMANARRGEAPLKFVPVMPAEDDVDNIDSYNELSDAILNDQADSFDGGEEEEQMPAPPPPVAVRRESAPPAAASAPGLPTAPGSPSGADYALETPTFAVAQTMAPNMALTSITGALALPVPRAPLPMVTSKQAMMTAAVTSQALTVSVGASRIVMLRMGPSDASGVDTAGDAAASTGADAHNRAAVTEPAANMACTEYSMAQLPDGRVVTSGRALTAHVWAPATGKLALQLVGHTQRVWCVSAAAAASHGVILTGSFDSTVRVWHATKGVCQAVFSGHTDKVWALTVLPGTSLLVSASWDGTCKVWDLDTVEPHWTPGSPRPEPHPRVGADPLLGTCTKHEGAVLSLIPLDESRFASGGADGAIRVWHARTAVCLAQLLGHEGPVTAMTAAPVSSLLVSGGNDCSVRVWHVPAGGQEIRTAPLRVLTSHSDIITCVLALPDGRVVSGGADSALWVWSLDPDAPTAAAPISLPGHRGAVSAMALVNDTLLATGDTEHQLLHWDLSRGVDGVTLARVQRNNNALPGTTPTTFLAAVAPAAAASSGRWAFTVSKTSPGIASLRSNGTDGSLRIQFQPAPAGSEPAAKPTRAGSPLRRGSPPPGSAPKDAAAAAASSATSVGETAAPGTFNSVHTATTLVDGRVAVTCGDCTVRVFDPATGELSCILEGHTGRVWCLVEIPGSRLVATGSWDGTVRLWSVSSGFAGQCVSVLEGHSDRVWTLTVLNDRMLVSGGWDSLLRVWDITDPTQPVCSHVLCPTAGATPTSQSRIWCAAALGHEHMVAGASDGTQSVWNAVTGECIHNLAAGGDAAGHEGPVSAVAALGGGRHVSGGWDGTVRVWHAQKGVCERILAAEPRSKVTALAPLGMGRLAVASADGAIRVWDAARGVLMHDLGDHNGWVTFLAATPDGKLVSGGADNCVRLWDPLTGSCIRVFPASPGDAQVPCFAAQGVSGRLTTGRWCFTLPGGHDIVLEAKEFTL